MKLVPSLIEVMGQGYNQKTFIRDFCAGLSVAVIAIPLGLAFPIASGLTPDKGLYAAIVGGIIVAFFSGSRFQVFGASGALVVIIFSIASRYGYEGLLVTTILAGIILIFCGVFRLGFIIKYIPYPVTVGFTMGIGVLIFSSQIKDFLGLPMAETPPGFFDKWNLYIRHAVFFSPATTFISFLTLGSMIFIRKCVPKLPSPVVGVVVATLCVWVFNLPVDTIGSQFCELKPGLPSFNFFLHGIAFEDIREMLPEAFTLAVLIAIEALISCSVADGLTGTRHDSNMELIAQGLGNIGVAFFGGIPATGTIGRTVTNIRAGAYSSISAIVQALVLSLTIVYFFPVMKMIPLAALAGILVVVVYDMIDAPMFFHMFKGPKEDWGVMLLTFMLTVVLDLTTAVYIGVSVSSLFFIGKIGKLTELHTVTPESNGENIDGFPCKTEDIPKGVYIFSVSGPLFFGVAGRLQKILDAMGRSSKVLILYLHGMSTIDMTGLHTLEAFLSKPKGMVLLADIQPSVKVILKKVGIIRTVGEDHVFPTLQSALDEAARIVEKLNDS